MINKNFRPIFFIFCILIFEKNLATAQEHLQQSTEESSASRPGNDYIANAQLISKCGVSFKTTNRNASNSYTKNERCGNSYADDLDCNELTGNKGSDACYTVERDIWYKFCPQIMGEWEIVISPGNCQNKQGFQYAIFQGKPQNLGSQFLCQGGIPELNPNIGYTHTQRAKINIKDPKGGCIYIQLDGYAGDQCDFGIKLLAPPYACTSIIPARILSFKAERIDEDVEITWVSAAEKYCTDYVLEFSADGKIYIPIAKTPCLGRSLFHQRYSSIHNNVPKGRLYYRLSLYDVTGKVSFFY